MAKESLELSLLLRMSMGKTPKQAHPTPLSRMSEPQTSKRKIRSLKELNELWTDSVKEGSPTSKQRRTLLMNLKSGPGSQMLKGKRHSTPISQKSTRTLLLRLEETYPCESPNLLLRLCSPTIDLNDSEGKLMTSSKDCPKETLKMMKMNGQLPSVEQKKKACLGTKSPTLPPAKAVVSRLVKPLGNLERTCQGSNPSCKLPTTYLKEFHQPSGIESSEENQLTSIRSSPPCTMSSLMKRERDTWEMLKLFLPLQRLSSKSNLGQSGQRCFGDSSKQSHSFFPTEARNYMSMPITSKGCLQLSKPMPTPKSFSMTSQSVTELGEGKTSSSQTINDSKISVRQSCMQMELSTELQEPSRKGSRREVDQNLEEERKTSTNISIVKLGVNSTKRNATTDMHAKDVERETMERPTVSLKVLREPKYRMLPKYLRYNLWDPKSDFSPNTSDWTETVAPLWRPSASEFANLGVNRTISENPHLFAIVTPINVDAFETYLVSHPNQPFVHSVCQGLREGFWPWASTTKEGYPSMNDESQASPKDAEKADFLKKQ